MMIETMKYRTCFSYISILFLIIKFTPTSAISEAQGESWYIFLSLWTHRVEPRACMHRIPVDFHTDMQREDCTLMAARIVGKAKEQKQQRSLLAHALEQVRVCWRSLDPLMSSYLGDIVYIHYIIIGCILHTLIIIHGPFEKQKQMS